MFCGWIAARQTGLIGPCKYRAVPRVHLPCFSVEQQRGARVCYGFGMPVTKAKSQPSPKAAKSAKDKVVVADTKSLVMPPIGFAVGDKVSHPQFGAGKVAAIDGDKLSITFKDDRLRVIISDFVKRST